MVKQSKVRISRRGVRHLGGPTYSKKNLAAIASSIGRGATEVERHRRAFEAAAMWLRLNRAGAQIKRTPPSGIEKRMKQIAAAARKLLWHLDVFSSSKAADGPGAFELLEALSWQQEVS